MANCDSLCTQYKNGTLHTPMADINYATMEPWVEVKIGDFLITSGNSPSGSISNTSVLDMEYGAIGSKGNGGSTLKVTIIDENGSELHKFLEHLFGCIAKTGEHYRYKAKWGWCGRTTCFSGPSKHPESPEVTCLLQTINIVFNEGKVKYEITGNDLGPPSQVSRVDKDYGDENNKMYLKDAITQMSQEIDPKWTTEFINFDGSPCQFFPKGGIDIDRGPLGVWEGKQTSKIECIRRWLNDYRSNNGPEGKPFNIIWNYSKESPTLRITQPLTEDETLSLGTFIVNGGECSVVTSFTTNFNYLPGLAIMEQGGNIDNQTGKEEKVTPSYKDLIPAEKCQPTAGLSSVTIVDANAQNNYPDSEATKEVVKSNMINNQGMRTIVPVIEAEMRIIGNPTEPFVWPAFKGMDGKPASIYCGVIVVNPFQLKKTSGDCPMWMHSTDCNVVLSNKKWIVGGIHHQITGGNYTTTIKLTLNAPAVHIPPGDMGNGISING